MAVTELTPRQEKLSKFYKTRDVPLFGPGEYTLLAPAPDSILLTDENVTLALILFGDYFDRKLRSIVVAFWLPTLLFQLVCSPIGFLTLTGRLPTRIVILTFPGAIFPLLLLLRSHWIVIQALFRKWEPLFLTFYSIIWCLSITFIVGIFDLRCIFVWMVIFPSLMASTFADASAVRLDFAFLKGDLSIAALTMPPYLISLAYVFSIIVVLNTRTHIEVENRHTSLLADSSGLSFDIECSYLASSTGFTICLFIAKSITMLFYNSSRCISLDAAMSIDVVTFSRIVNTGGDKGIENINQSINRKVDWRTSVFSGKQSVKNEEEDEDDIMILETGFLLKGGIGLVPVSRSGIADVLSQSILSRVITQWKSITNTLFRKLSRQTSPHNSSEVINQEETVIPLDKIRKVFSMEDIRIVPQISTRKISNIISLKSRQIAKVNPCPTTNYLKVPMNCASPKDDQHHAPVVLHQLVNDKKSSFESVKRQPLVRDATEIHATNEESEQSKFVRIAKPLSLLRPHKIKPEILIKPSEGGHDRPSRVTITDNDFNGYNNNDDNNILSRNGDVCVERHNDLFDNEIEKNNHNNNDLENILSSKDDLHSEPGSDNNDIPLLKDNLGIQNHDDKDEISVLVNNICDNHTICNHSNDINHNDIESKNDSMNFCRNMNNNFDEKYKRTNKNNKENDNNNNHKQDNNNTNKNDENNNETDMINDNNDDNRNKLQNGIINEKNPLSGRQQRLYPFYKSVNAKIFGPNNYTLLSPMTSCILVSDECETVASVLFGENFDYNLRIFVRYLWYPAYFFQIGCLPIGVLSLLGHVSNWGALLMIPGFIFPMMMILQCHWKVLQVLLYNWEQIFITLYSTIFCISITLIVHDYRSVYAWVVIYPTLISSAFSDASAVRLDHSFLHKSQQKFVLRNVILYACPSYVASLAYIFSIVILINIKVKLPFFLYGYLNIQSALLDTQANYGVTATSTGVTIIIFMSKCLFKLIKEPSQCVSLRAPMTVEIANLEPAPADAATREAGIITYKCV